MPRCAPFGFPSLKILLPYRVDRHKKYKWGSIDASRRGDVEDGALVVVVDAVQEIDARDALLLSHLVCALCGGSQVHDM